MTKPRLTVAAGQRFGRLTVADPETRKIMPSHPKGVRAARCLCDCGAETVVWLRDLIRGDTTSCGCLHRERARAWGAQLGSSPESLARLRAVTETPEHRERARALGRRVGSSAENVERLREMTQTPEHRERAREMGQRRGSSPENLARMAEFSRSPENRARLAERNKSAEHRGEVSVHGLAAHPLYDTWAGMLARCHNPKSAAWMHYGGRGIQVCREWHGVAVFVAWVEANLGARPEGHSLDRIDNDGDYEPGNVRWATALEQAANRRPSRRAATA
jgi:hypothetical protein